MGENKEIVENTKKGDKLETRTAAAKSKEYPGTLQ